MFCLGASLGGTDLISCSNITDRDTSYCCDHTINCCQSGVGRFEVQPPRPDLWATWDSDATQFAVIGTKFEESRTTSATIASTTESTTETTLATTTSIDRSTSPTSIEINNPQSTQSSPPAPPAFAASSESSGLSTGAMAGIGVGAGVGVILIAAVVYLLWRNNKNKKLLQQAQAPVVNSQSMYGPGTMGAWPAQYETAKPAYPQYQFQRQELDASSGYSGPAELSSYR
ncbi:hypothetical protein B0I35DRAFT_503757 [Stachybotrys elegans]|uniref:Mid2 domain-containing protein n=1 Tax=Stachybotrys elegans TaxID=80388 RepID=A0A8K0SNB9_9HYPO|nr:hypothetical protein B0I35DRAFT_503757 [Stachybotrys elegans]